LHSEPFLSNAVKKPTSEVIHKINTVVIHVPIYRFLLWFSWQCIILQSECSLQCNQDYFHGKFNIGVCLHACGTATDMVLQQSLNNDASFVICPCCYGGIQNTHLMSYPRSELFRNANIPYKVNIYQSTNKKIQMYLLPK